jgi:predicted MFS family arabinose efflux permease
MGYHTVLQTQYALGMSLTTEAHSGRILGRMSAISNGGALAAMVLTLVTFHYGWLSFRPAFVIAGILALLGALAIVRFPSLHDGKMQEHIPRREPIVLRRSYRFYYYLSLLDGGRQQIFFSFGLWVLVHEYRMSVPEISALLIAVRGGAMLTSPWIGRMIDHHGERSMLSLVNIAYIVALGGYALVHNVYVASLCYVIYSFIFPLSSIGAATYLRKVAVAQEIAPSLAMGVSLQHTAAIVVPVATGFILNYVGFQVPFLIACGFAIFTIFVTQRLDPVTQKSPARLAEDEARMREQVLVG